MELSEIKSMWQAHEMKLEKTLKLNLHCLAMIQSQKVKSKLSPLLWQRIIEVVLHIVVIWWLVGFLYNHLKQWGYVLSALSLIAFYIVAFINCVKQIIIIRQIDYSNDVLHLQSSLEKLQVHVVNYMRLTFLVFPTYLAYPIIACEAFLGVDLLQHLHGNWWKAQIIFCMLLVPVSIWLYKEISYKNIHKKWVKFIIGMAGNRVLESMEFLKELETLKAGK